MLSLRRKADFHTLFQHRRRAYGQWAVLHTRLRALGEGPPLPRLAVSTTGKFPNAVQRNRARRLLRETCRLLISDLREPWDILFIVRPAILTTTFPDRRHAILDLLLQSGLPVEQAGSGSAGVSPAPEPAGKNPASCPSDPEGTLGVP